MTKTAYASRMTLTDEVRTFLAGEGWEWLEPLERDQGWLYRTTKQDTVVQASTIAELCRRTWDVDRGKIRPPVPWQSN